MQGVIKYSILRMNIIDVPTYYEKNTTHDKSLKSRNLTVLCLKQYVLASLLQLDWPPNHGKLLGVLSYEWMLTYKSLDKELH